MKSASEPFLAWPGMKHLWRFALLTIVFSMWWVLIYGGASWITAQRTTRFRVHFDSELAIPFWPPMVLAYQSVFPALWLSPFILRRPEELDRFAMALGGITLVGGLCFLMVPADLAYGSVPHAGSWEPLMQFSRWASLEYNLLPSLHVGLAVTCLGIYASRSKLKMLLWSWAAAVAAATLLIHHHHVVDVIGGWLLGLAGCRWFLWRTAAVEHATRYPIPGTSA